MQSSTIKRLIKKLQAREETKNLPVRDDEYVVFNRGAYGDCFRCSMPYAGIASDYTMTDILNCRQPLSVTEVSEWIYIAVPDSEMRRLHPQQAEKGIW